MRIKVIITGSTGMVGKGVLLECLDSMEVAEVLVVNRSSVNMEHPKLTELLINDFFDLTEIENKFEGYDACYFCLGTSSMGKSEQEYKKLTYDLTVNFAKSFLEKNENSSFCYVSGAGTDSTEKGRSMWARVKGRTENALLELPFSGAYMFRPGFIEPVRGTKTKVRAFQILYVLMKPFYPIFRLFPKAYTDTSRIGRAMINAAIKGYDKKHIEIIDINTLSK